MLNGVLQNPYLNDRSMTARLAALLCMLGLLLGGLAAAQNPEADNNPESDLSHGIAWPDPVPDDGSGIVCDSKRVCRERITGLPFQVLPRSFSNIYEHRSTDATRIVEANVPSFVPLFVFQVHDVDWSAPGGSQGWYRVGRYEAGPAMGWMRTDDVLEWRQPLVVAYTHPGPPGEGRQRALMFESKQQVLDLLAAEDAITRVIGIYAGLQQGRVAKGLISKEPERFVDISRDFYLLPIIDYEVLDRDGEELRVLQLASALPQRRGADTLQDADFLKASMRQPRELMDQAARELSIDLVFVMDMTRSMQPYIDRTRDAIAEIAKRAVDSGVGEKVRFGLVGFRDDVRLTPALEFTAKDFTPQLLDIAAFETLLRTEARAAKVSTVGFAEEAFAGIDTALRANWREDSLRMVVLVTDASSHPLGHAQNTTGKDARTLQLEADDQQVHIIALHLHDARHPGDHSLARQQYAVLAGVRGNPDQVAMVSVNTEDKVGFQSAVETIGRNIAQTIAQAQAGTLDDASDPTSRPDSPSPDDPASQAKDAVRAVINAAMMEYLGRDAEAPKDFVAWTLDRDLTNLAINSLDVRVLLNKRQLNDLIVVLENILGAIDEASISNKQFFTALRELSGQAMKDPDALTNASDLSQAGLLPAYIESLPYHSDVLLLTDEMFAWMTAEQRARLQSTLRAKLRAYRDISSDVDGWQRLRADSSDLDQVYPLRLDYLP